MLEASTPAPRPSLPTYTAERHTARRHARTGKPTPLLCGRGAHNPPPRMELGPRAWLRLAACEACQR